MMKRRDESGTTAGRRHANDRMKSTESLMKKESVKVTGFGTGTGTRTIGSDLLIEVMRNSRHLERGDTVGVDAALDPLQRQTAGEKAAAVAAPPPSEAV